MREAEGWQRPCWSAYASSGVLDNATLRSKISLYYGCSPLLLHSTEKLLFYRLWHVARLQLLFTENSEHAYS